METTKEQRKQQQEKYTREHTLSQDQLKKLIKDKFERASAMYYSIAKRESVQNDR